MIRLYYTEISTLPETEAIAAALPASFSRAYFAAHPKASRAGLGALWLAAQAGADGPLIYNEKGRPSFSGGLYTDLSISHTDRLAFCALAEGDHKRIGLDAEDGGGIDEERIQKIAARFFSAEERAILFGGTDRKQAFLELWTRKEAYAKYCGDGLAAVLFQKEFEGVCHFKSGVVAGTSVSICADCPMEQGFPAAEKVEFFVKHG